MDKSLDGAGLIILMAVIVLVGVKDGAIKKLIRKYAVMLNSLLSMICFLPSVDSFEGNSSYDGDKIGITIIPVITSNNTSNNGTTNEKDGLSSVQVMGIVISSIVGVIGSIMGCCTFYHEYIKKKN